MGSATAGLFALDRQPAGADIDMEPLRLVAIPIELIAHDGDGDRQRADDQIEHVAAVHGAAPSKSESQAQDTMSDPAMRATRYLTPSSSTSKISVALGGMTPPAPRAP